VTTCIALLRGLGFPNTLPMKELARLLEKLGLRDVRTYIQSGNAVFRAAKADARLGERITAAIRQAHGFAPQTLVLTREELVKMMKANPYRAAEKTPQFLHVTFLFEKPASPDLATLEKWRKPNERFTLKGKVFYLHAPDGVGKSKLFARIEKSLGVAGTARNWNTVAHLREMAEQAG
jgi:uncharacterized protein (DUF1697 family)